MPQLAEGMSSAKIATWIKKEGDPVRSGDILAEVETDKTAVELEAPSAGVLQTIHVPAGATAAVGDVLATIGEAAAGETVAQERRNEAKAPASVTARQTVDAPAAGQVVRPETHEPVAPAQPRDPSIEATPLAARMAALAGIDLSSIRSPVGRIRKVDVDNALGYPSSAERTPVVASAFEEQPLSAVRRVTGERLQRAKQTIPHFYLHVDCTVDDLLNVRTQLNARQSDVKITITDFIVFALARALRKVPAANSGWIDGGVRVFKSVDIAVAVDTPKGLITPVVRGVQEKPLNAISRELRALVDRARNGELKPDEYSGGTITLSNLGMSGVSGIVPIINPPQSCILGVGAIESRPVVKDGHVVAGQVMTCTLAADHRAIDGAMGAELLRELRRFLEDPMSLVLV
jgi:pyruvate dehydrogenase E2 component (dihydrolipoamide acetyltransferase)